MALSAIADPPFSPRPNECERGYRRCGGRRQVLPPSRPGRPSRRAPRLRLTPNALCLCSAPTRPASFRARSSVVEHPTFNRMVDGSNPSGRTTFRNKINKLDEVLRRVQGCRFLVSAACPQLGRGFAPLSAVTVDILCRPIVANGASAGRTTEGVISAARAVVRNVDAVEATICQHDPTPTGEN